jgi:hypothetical protein
MKSRRMRWTGNAARMEAEMNAYRVLVGTPEERDHLEDLRGIRRWEDNIKMDLREIGAGGMDRIHVTQDRNPWRAGVNTVTNLRVP